MSHRTQRRRQTIIPSIEPARIDQLTLGHFSYPELHATQVRVYPWDGSPSYLAAGQGMADARRRHETAGRVHMTGNYADPATGETVPGPV